MNAGNDLEGREVYTATREELGAVARHWMTFILDEDFSSCCFQGHCWGDMAAKYRAHERLVAIEVILGKEVFKKLWDESRAAFSKSIGQQLWRIMTEATGAERDQFAADNERRSNYFRKKFFSDTLADRAFARLAGNATASFKDEEGDTWFFGVGPFAPHDRLSLAIWTRDGETGFDGSRSIERPEGWTPLRRAAGE